jgi:hypothetical protein
MILEKEVQITGHPRNIKYYTELGYNLSVRDKILVNVEDLMPGSTVVINYQCDNCSFVTKSQFREYYSYTNGLKDEYYCISCNKTKFKKTLLEKYGVDNPMKVKSVKDKLKKTLMSKYGVDHFSKTEEYKEMYKNTCKIKYGVDNASKSTFIKNVISDKKFKQNNSIEKYKDILPNEYKIVKYSNSRNFIINHEKCGLEFEIFIGTLYDRHRGNNIICTNCNPIDNQSSSGENEVKEYLRSLGVDFIENSYDIINPLSLDIYIPKLNLAIEYNGVYWHSDVYHDSNYHLNKTNLCNEVGIELFHIWEDDWKFKNNIVKSILSNKFINSNKIHARKCYIKEVDDINLIRDFLNKNHIQGYTNSKYKIGLYYNNELVSLMCFSKKRKNMELVRFCTKLENVVVGGASKLFSYFLNKYDFDELVSFSDISGFNGDLYLKLGFENVSDTKPNYWWVVDGVRKHRFNFNKSILVSKFKADPNLSEREIMKSMGYNRIWGCGLKKWVHKR